MIRKMNLARMLEEIPLDESITTKKTRLASQQEIKRLLARRKKKAQELKS